MKEREAEQELALLRSYLTEASEQNWDGIVALLQSWPVDSLQIALSYAKAHLESWPDELKKYPDLGLEELLSKPKAWSIHQIATTLDLTHNDIGDEGAKALAESETLSRLTTLNLGDNDIGEEGVKALAEPKTLSRLTTLHLSINDIGVEGAMAIASSQYLHKNIRSRFFEKVPEAAKPQRTPGRSQSTQNPRSFQNEEGSSHKRIVTNQ